MTWCKLPMAWVKGSLGGDTLDSLIMLLSFCDFWCACS